MASAGGFTRLALLGSFALAAISLLLPFAPAFDAWAWLIWARELAGGELDTSAGSSWKPLPPLLLAPFAPLGDAAPGIWLLLSRAGWLAAVALCGRVAWRLARAGGLSQREGVIAGIVAAVGLVLLADGFTPWLRQFAGGLSEPLLVALLLGAVESHIAGRPRLAIALLAAGALLRPEAFPFLIGYVVWAQRAARVPAPAALAVLLLVPALWLLGDLAGSGSALTGAERARADEEGPLTNGPEAVWRSVNLAPAALLAAAIGWVATPGSRRPDLAAGLVVAAAAWAGIVVVLALAGYAGLPRFAAPAGALVCAVGGAGLIALVGRGARARALAGVLVVALILQGAVRAAELPGAASEAEAMRDDLDGMRAVVAAVGPGRIASCPPLSTSDLLSQSALAWELEKGVASIDVSRLSVPRAGLALVGPGAEPGAVPAPSYGPPLVERGGWRAWEISCPASSAGTGPAAAQVRDPASSGRR